MGRHRILGTHRSLPAVPAPTYPPAPTYVPTGPLTEFGDGVYEVGTSDGQVAPGKYKAANPDHYGYYALLKHNDGDLGDIINSDISQGPMQLTVPKTAGYVKVSGCTFTKV
jgi:hypothetical protein